MADNNQTEIVLSELPDIPGVIYTPKQSKPPWYGFPPRIVAVALNGKIDIAVWEEGVFTETDTLDSDIKTATDLLRIGETFNDFIVERYLFGARLAIGNYLDDTPKQAALYATIIDNAEWAGLILAAPVNKPTARDTASALARKLGFKYG